CEVILMHIKDEILGDDGKIDPFKLDAVSRMGGDWYCRASGDNLFKLPQPGNKLGIGMDYLPENIRNSKVLTGNDLALLAGVEKIPDVTDQLLNDQDRSALQLGKEVVHQRAQTYLKE